MKKRLLALAVLAILCTGDLIMTSCSNPGNDETSYVPSKLITLDSIRAICQSDTVHHKAFVFASPYCPGCEDYLKNTLQECFEVADEKNWQIYVIETLYPISKDREDDYIRKMAQLGVPEDHLYFLQGGLTEDTYKDFVSMFNIPSGTKFVELYDAIVPRSFCIDRHNYIGGQQGEFTMVIGRTHKTYKKYSGFEEVSFCKATMELSDFSRELTDSEWRWVYEQRGLD